MPQVPAGQGKRTGAELEGGHETDPMTKQEKMRLFTVLRTTEYLFMENIALKLVLEHREVVYEEIEGSEDPSAALEDLLGNFPVPKKEH